MCLYINTKEVEGDPPGEIFCTSSSTWEEWSYKYILCILPLFSIPLKGFFGFKMMIKHCITVFAFF